MTLEQRFRRLTRLFPREWREEHEEDLVATLLDASPPGQERVPVGDALDLIRSAMTVRARAVVPGRQPALIAGGAFGAGLVAIAFLGMTTGIGVEFLLTSLLVVLAPGTGVVYTVSSAVTGGRHRGMLAAMGCTLGIVPHLLAAILGLSGVMQAGAVAFETVRWAGVAYLVYLGISMIRDRGNDAGLVRSESADRAISGSRVVRRAILLNLLNPKLTIFFLAFLPQFLDARSGLVDARLLGLSGVFMLMTLMVFTGYAFLSAALRERLLRKPALVVWVQRTMGALVIGFAARLAITDR